MALWARIGTIPVLHRVATVLWLSFLMAGIATGFFFSAIDPLELKYCVDFPEVNRTAAYSIGFLLFWLLTSSSSLLAAFFIYPTQEPEHKSDQET
jgi:hypothetical protein